MTKRANSGERRLNAYHRITTDPGLDLDGKLGKLLRFARASFRMPIAVLARIEQQRFEVVHSVPRNSLIKAGTILDLAHTYCADTIQSNHPVAFTRVSGTPRQASECFQKCQLEAYLGMRVVVAGKPWGTLALLGTEVRAEAFTDHDMHFIHLLAEWVGNALTWRAETAELRELVEWRKAVFSGIDIGIIACDTDGIWRELNPAAERMFGIAQADLAGCHSVSRIISSDSLAERFNNVANPANSVEALDTSDHFQAECHRANGTVFPAQITVSTLRGKSGTVRAHILLVQDITERVARESAERRMRATELASTVLRGFGDTVIGVDSVPPYRIRLLNTAGERLLALNEAEALGKPLQSCLDMAADGGRQFNQISDWLAGSDIHYGEATVHVTGDGTFPASLSITRIDTDHGAADAGLIVITLRNIAHRKEAEKRLRLSDKVFENSAEAILITDAAGTILSVNPAFCWITGYSADEAVGKTPNILKSGRHDAAFYTAMWLALIDNGHWEGEIWDRHKAGHLYPKWMTINAVREGGRITHYVALFSDISARKEQEERIRFLAEHDQLTGLPNRHFLKQHFGLLKLSDRRRDRSLALMMIDLDEFKQVNDTLGHAAGDELLMEVARRLVASVRDSDIVVRLGGDEFVILLEDVRDRSHIESIASKIHEAVSQPVAVHDTLLRTSPSIGIALGPDDGDDVEALLRKADIAMYQVKVAGRNAWCFYADNAAAPPSDKN